jgi:hypothetical protein
MLGIHDGVKYEVGLRNEEREPRCLYGRLVILCKKTPSSFPGTIVPVPTASSYCALNTADP